MCLMEKINVLDKLSSGMSYSVIGWSSVLMNQQCIVNKVCLNRNTHGYVWLGDAMLWPEAHKNLTLFPQEKWLAFVNFVFGATL